MRLAPRSTASLRRAGAYLAASLLLLTGVGCPHRSPLFSPDGKSVLVLTDADGEEVKKAASQLWLVSVDARKARRLDAPQKDLRFLAAAWLDGERFVVVTGRWEGGYIEADSEALWLVREGGESWQPVKGPRPSESRITMHPPVVCEREGAGPVVVYPSGEESVVAVDPASGDVVARTEPAEVIGAAAAGGFLVERPEEGDTGDTEIAALSTRGAPLWKRTFASLRAEIAAAIGKKPVEVVFNDTSTSRVVADGGRVGLTLVFSDVSWKEGLAGYYVELDADGKLTAAVPARGVWGRPASSGGKVLGVAPPASEEKLPLRIVEVDVASREPLRTMPLEGLANKDIYGYAIGPAGDRFAVSIGGARPALRLYDVNELAEPVTIPLHRVP